MAVTVSWGVLNIEAEKLTAAGFESTINLIEIEKVSGFSALQKTHDPLSRPKLTLSLNYQYGNPLSIYNDLNSKMINLYAGNLLIGKKNLGLHLLATIGVTLVEIDDSGNWLRADLALEFVYDRGS